MSQYLPLEGIRICDFTGVWAGQSATMYLADMGAECIKVENPYVWNAMTRAASPVIDAQTCRLVAAWMGGHPESDPGPRPWNNAPAFIHVLRNKKSFTVDSRRPEGLEIVRSLIRMSDVVAENQAIGTLTRLGLSDDEIRAVRPDVVILHQPAFGRTGEYVEGRGYGAHIDSVAGGSMVRGYPDSAPMTNTQIFASDFVAGSHAAVALLAALRHRRRTGEGQVVEVAQFETAAQMFPQAALDGAWNGREHRTIGNRSVEGFVPNGVFPCAGDRRWIAISCRSEEEWLALVRYMGRPAWSLDPELGTTEGRRAHEDQLEAEIADFTSSRDQSSLFRELQEAGVTAGPVLNAAQASEDPHLVHNEVWTPLPATADYPATQFPAPAMHFSRSDVRLRTPPVPFGAHNDYVYRELLGLHDDEVAALEAGGHIRDRYDDVVLEEFAQRGRPGGR